MALIALRISSMWAFLITVCIATIVGSVGKFGAGLPNAVAPSIRAIRSSVICTRLIDVTLAVSVGSVKGKEARPPLALSWFAAWRSSVICTLLIGVTPVTKGSSVNALENVAVTEVSAFRVTVQVPVPEQPPPLQPAKAKPLAGVAVSVTTVPLV